MYQKKFDFPNGYGASVICHSQSYGGSEGLCEVAVLKNGKICYDDDLPSLLEVQVDGVIGHLDFGEVQHLLTRIQGLTTKE